MWQHKCSINVNSTTGLFQLLIRLSFSQNTFRLCTTLGPRQAVCQAQHSQGCYVFYKIVNFHLCWKVFSPRHLPTAYWKLVLLLRRGCRYSPQRQNSKFNVSRSMLGLDHVRKIWWEGEKNTEIISEMQCMLQNNMLAFEIVIHGRYVTIGVCELCLTNKGGTLRVPNPSHLIRIAGM